MFGGIESTTASDARIPARFNWAGCRVAQIRGQVTVLLMAPTSTSCERTEGIRADAMAQFARATGLQRLSKAGSRTGGSDPGTLVVTSAGIAVRADRVGVAIGGFVDKLPALPETVDVVIVAGGPHRVVTDLERLKTASRQGLTVGMPARVLDLRPRTERIDEVGRFIGAGGDDVAWPAPGDRVLLDQNILISLDNCLARSDQRLWEHVRDLFGWLAICDAVSGFALAECVNAGSVDLADRLQAVFAVFMRHAHDAVSIDDLRAAASTYKPPKHERLDAGVARMTELTDLNYVGILHALRVWKAIPTEAFIPRDRIAAWRDWLQSVSVDFLGVSAYYRLAVRLLLLSENNGPRNSPGSLAMGLLKFRASPTAASLRGAAWDLAYLFLADLARMGETDLTGSGPVVMLTADKSLQGLARAGFLAAAVYESGGTSAFVVHRRQESDRFSQKQLSAIEELDQQVVDEQEARADSGRTLDPYRLRAEIRTLERDLGLR